MDFISKIDLNDINFSLVKQNFNNEKIENVREEVIKELDSIEANKLITPNMKIGVTAGSRGISNIVTITRTICDYIKDAGGTPYIIPAMGSHGGATAEGQLHVLESLGITEESMGCPIKSSMEVVQLGTTESGVPVYFDKVAYSMDGVIVVNRIKPHTDFESQIESGLTKMIAVGLGNQMGCATMHEYGLRTSIPESARVSKEKVNFLLGLGIIENSKDETYKLKAVLPEDFETEEKKLLIEAKGTVPKLPVDNLDILVVKEMGKMISGTGMDTKVLGRIKILGEVEPITPKINKVVVLNLASNSYGNALGVGLADITTKKLVDSIDFDATYANIISTSFLERGKVPITVSNDKNAIIVGINTVGVVNAENIKIGIIKNTLDLQEMYLSEGALKDMDNSKIEIIQSGIKLSFDTDGNLTN
ncbi:MAG: lactate racemase domain-containing protein [Tissierellaceae bacterium]|nr:lactate racemase domain-containing protein [Tissierellaceae bacterium]